MSKTGVRSIEISPDQSGRRLDNYLVGVLKSVPKSFIYRIIRRGEVRVNGSRSRPDRKLVEKDVVRIPPVMEAPESDPVISSTMRALIAGAIVYEDNAALILNKPAGVAVHGGSGLRYGAIDVIRDLRPEDPAIELVHRLDRDTSGCLVFAKDYPSLRHIQRQMASPECRKTYIALVSGEFSETSNNIDYKLATSRIGGEKTTVVSSDGKPAATEFTTLERFAGLSLVEARISTGRTHQIRVHGAAAGHPIAGDKKYGDAILNAQLRKRGLNRMFLHAHSITLTLGQAPVPITIEAPMPDDLSSFLPKLQCAN